VPSEGVIAHLDGRAVDEVGTSMPHRDSRFGEAVFGSLWHWNGEGALEADQVWPAKGQARRRDQAETPALTISWRRGSAIHRQQWPTAR
jgi:hypothetical protein